MVLREGEVVGREVTRRDAFEHRPRIGADGGHRAVFFRAEVVVAQAVFGGYLRVDPQQGLQLGGGVLRQAEGVQQRLGFKAGCGQLRHAQGAAGSHGLGTGYEGKHKTNIFIFRQK